jgi:hypothetical protein
LNPKESYRSRWTRILKAVRLEAPDRVPVVLEYSGFAAWVTGTPMADFLRSPDRNIRTMMQAYRLIGGGDAINYGSFWPYGLCYDYMAKVRVPGVDLPANDMWQVVESELLQREDYDRLLEMGWPAFFDHFMRQRVLEDVPDDYLPPRRRSLDSRSLWLAAGLPVLSGGDVTTPFELLCGARSLPRFAADLIEIPDKVETVMQAIVRHLAAPSLRRAAKSGYPAVWIGGWQTAPCMLSPAMWDRFVWPYFKMLVEEVVDSGLIALLHLDSDWTRELKRFRELPPGRCIIALDGTTDIERAKRAVGDQMCIMGDVPASMLYLQAPGEVHAYCRRLIQRIGPVGFILQSGCDIPVNARLENVRAMVAAALSA